MISVSMIPLYPWFHDSVSSLFKPLMSPLLVPSTVTEVGPHPRHPKCFPKPWMSEDRVAKLGKELQGLSNSFRLGPQCCLGWDWCPFLGICFTSPKHIYLLDMKYPQYSFLWCETLGHLPTPVVIRLILLFLAAFLGQRGHAEKPGTSTASSSFKGFQPELPRIPPCFRNWQDFLLGSENGCWYVGCGGVSSFHHGHPPVNLKITILHG